MERARWTNERLGDRMSAIDTSFEHVFEELRAERAELRAEMRAVSDRLSQLDERLGRIGFRGAAILATGLLGMIAAQLWG